MPAAAPRPRESFPGSALLHPLVLGAVALLLLNDHVFKARWPSWWTGKLSDVAGLVMFPLVLQALWEQARAWGGRGFRPSRGVWQRQGLRRSRERCRRWRAALPSRLHRITRARHTLRKSKRTRAASRSWNRRASFTIAFERSIHGRYNVLINPSHASCIRTK